MGSQQASQNSDYKDIPEKGYPVFQDPMQMEWFPIEMAAYWQCQEMHVKSALLDTLVTRWRTVWVECNGHTLSFWNDKVRNASKQIFDLGCVLISRLLYVER